MIPYGKLHPAAVRWNSINSYTPPLPLPLGRECKFVEIRFEAALKTSCENYQPDELFQIVVAAWNSGTTAYRSL